MKLGVAAALAFSLALSTVTAPAAMAQQQAFRTAEARTFTADELQRYGLSSADAAQVQAYQQAGYQVQVITPEEAQRYHAGQFTQTQWIVIGIIVLIVVVAAASD